MVMIKGNWTRADESFDDKEHALDWTERRVGFVPERRVRVARVLTCSPHIKRFLSRRHSKGDQERRGGKYKHHADSSFDTDFFIRIFRDKSRDKSHTLNAVVPKARL
eukprot:3034893-Prymnesium_polylepis.1